MGPKMFALALVLLAAGCSDAAEYKAQVPAAEKQADATASTAGSDASTATVITSTASASASSSETKGGARAIAVNNDLMEFSYAYPAAAGAEPELKKLLDAKLDAARAEIIEQAQEAKADATANDYPYRQHSLTIEWKVVADLPSWLSLTEHVGSYSGGAHGNYGTGSLVWDRKAATARKSIDMFSSPAALDAAIRAPYCKALDAERLKRRGQTSQPGDIFGDCPKLEELTLLLGSSNGKAFNRIGLIADPYVAGSYAEGDYEVTLPVNAAVLRSVKPEFRSAFLKGS